MLRSLLSNLYWILSFICFILALPYSLRTAREWWSKVKAHDWRAFTTVDWMRLGLLVLGSILLVVHISGARIVVQKEPVVEEQEEPVLEETAAVETEPPHIYVRERSPIEILNVVAPLPPLQQAKYYKKAYDGRWVRWNSIVFRITGGDTGGVGVTVLDRWDLPVMVSMDFPASQRPLLETLRTGDRIEYEGKIDGGSYDWLSIRLDDARVLRVFPDTTR
jgi:hypothetical protein